MDSDTESERELVQGDELTGETATATELASPPSNPAALQPGRPILWRPAAWAVSLGTSTALGAVRTTRTLGALPFHATKFTVLTSIELGRVTIESVLGFAGRDVYAQARTDLGRAQADSAVTSVFDTIHRGVTYIQLFTAAGFETMGRSLATVADLTEFGFTLLDGLFGSTESSRALRSIGAFLIREFQNPATGRLGEKVGALDLFFAFVSLVYLQSICRLLDEQENDGLGVEEIIWDIVVQKGRRVDAPASAEQTAEDVDQVGEMVETRLRRQVINAIPPYARVASSTSMSTTVTIDIAGCEPPLLDLPLGVELIEVNKLGPSDNTLLNPRPHAVRSERRGQPADLPHRLPFQP